MKSLEKQKNKINTLLSLIKNELDVDIEQMKSSTRKRPVVIARRVFYNIINDNVEDMSQSDISSVFNRHRTTFIHHRKEHLNQINQYEDYTELYEKLEEAFKEQTKNKEKCSTVKEQNY